jgi:hypothetical protein
MTIWGRILKNTLKLYNYVNYEKVDMFSFVADFSGGPTGQDIKTSPKKQLQHLPGPDRSGLSPPPGWTYPLGRHRPAQIQLLGQPHLWKPKKKVYIPRYKESICKCSDLSFFLSDFL